MDTSSHTLAKQLLALPDKPLLIIESAGMGTVDYQHYAPPWDDGMGKIRLAIGEAAHYEVAVGKPEERPNSAP